MRLGAVFGGRGGGFWRGAYQVMSAPSFTGKSFGWGSQVLGGCLCLGAVLGGEGGGSGGMLSN